MGAFFLVYLFYKILNMPTRYKILIFTGSLLIPLLLLWFSDLIGLLDLIKWSPLPMILIFRHGHIYRAGFIIVGILQALSMFRILKDTPLLLKIMGALFIVAVYYYLSIHFWIESLHPENPY